MTKDRGTILNPVYISKLGTTTVGVGAFSLLFTAVGIWILDILGLNVWVAHTIGDFIGLIAERV